MLNLNVKPANECKYDAAGTKYCHIREKYKVYESRCQGRESNDLNHTC